jgi:hypothetical protein
MGADAMADVDAKRHWLSLFLDSTRTLFGNNSHRSTSIPPLGGPVKVRYSGGCQWSFQPIRTITEARPKRTGGGHIIPKNRRYFSELL